MAHSFVYPTVALLPCGYEVTIVPPIAQIAGRIGKTEATVRMLITRYRDGEAKPLREALFDFKNGKLVGGEPSPLVLGDPLDDGGTSPAFLEVQTASADDRPIFKSKAVFGLYTIYGKPGKKPFFSDNAYKYGSPNVIGQMARFRVYVDTYAVIHIDRQRGLGESLMLINPYMKPIVCSIKTQDGRSLKRRKIEPQSAAAIDLSEILREGEDRWAGHIQLTANNRLITFTVKHRFGDQTDITDIEHMDPFRDDPTHMPLAQKLRQQAGDWIATLRT